jgi:succinyl-diaminopimelate desuccinylase
MESLFARIAAKREDVVALTRALVSIPSVNPPGRHYRDCAEIIGERLRRRGFDVRYLRAEGSPGDSARYPRDNVVARWEGSRPGPCVHFNGHIDVVPAGGGWSFEPFAASVHDGRIYGRGTCDMKGGLAAAIVAVEALIEAYPDLPGAIEISGTADEETGGYGGVAYLAEQGYFSKPRVDHVIIPEPLNVDRVCLGHRGVWWAEVETQGHGAHGSMPFLGDCAVRHMGAFVQRLEEELFPRLERRRTDMPVVPPGAKRSTLNLNAVHGGLAEGYEGLPAPMVPESCRLVIDRRFPVEETLEAVRGEIVAILEDLEATRPGFRFALRDVM